jgi:protein-tyrosine phosphatase
MTDSHIEPFAIFDVLHETGGRLALCRLPGRSDDLPGDLAILTAWKPALIVSMTEPAEAARFGAAALPESLARLGIAHLVFPIRDFGAPEAHDGHWTSLAPQLHAVLDRQDGIVLHCLGGKGRSGMIAVRLLVERGIEHQTALAAVRHARPGAVETDAQVRWAQNRANKTR